MKEIKIQEINPITKYQAIDGEVFDDKEQCLIYEKSAKCLILGRVFKCKVGEPQDAWCLMGGLDDNVVQAYKFESEKEADYFIQWVFSFSTWWQEDRRQKFIDDIYTALKNKDVALVGFNCDNEPYYINTRQNIIDNLKNLDNV